MEVDPNSLSENSLCGREGLKSLLDWTPNEGAFSINFIVNSLLIKGDILNRG